MIGEADGEAGAERVVVLACEIDDMNPQIFGVLMDQLYAAGALEVFYQPVQMKKNRPGRSSRSSRRPAARVVSRDRLPRDDDHRRPRSRR